MIDTIIDLGTHTLDQAPPGTAQFRLLRDSGTMTRFIGMGLRRLTLGSSVHCVQTLDYESLDTLSHLKHKLGRQGWRVLMSDAVKSCAFST